MARRLFRPQYAFGEISWDDYRTIALALIARKKAQAGPFQRSESLLIQGDTELLCERWLTFNRDCALGRLLDVKSKLLARIVVRAEKVKDSASLSLSSIGYALVKSIERNGLGTGLLDHTANAPSWREAQLAELAVRFATKPGQATIPLADLRWWLGIEGRYPRLANIKDTILDKLEPTQLNLRVVDAQEATAVSTGFVSLRYTPPKHDLANVMLESPHANDVKALAERLGVPVIAAAVFIEDGKELRPGDSRDEIMTALAQ